MNLRASIDFFLYFRNVDTYKEKQKECMFQEKVIEAYPKGKKYDQVRANISVFNSSSTSIVSGVHGVNLLHPNDRVNYFQCMTLYTRVLSNEHNVYPSKVHSCLCSFSVYFLTIHAHLKKKNYGNLQRLRDIFLSMLNSILKNQKTLRGMWISKLLSIFQQVQKTNQLGNSIEEHSWSSVSCQL